MPETLSADIRTGYNPQTAFDIRFDTFSRLNEVFNRPSKGFGIDYYDPLSRVGGQQGTQAIAPTPPMDFNTALFSDDPKVRTLALETLEKSTYADPYTRLGIGQEYRTPATRETEKFIDSKYGYDMFSDNEDFYYRNSYMDDSWFTRALKNVGRFQARVAVGTVTKFLEGVGYLGSMVVNGVVDGAKALGGTEVNYWQDVADNTFSKIMKNANDDFRDYVVPVYRQAGFDEKGFFSQLGNYAFWNDSFADGVAFFASAFIPAGIASKTGLLAKGLGLGATVAQDASLAARAGGLLRGAIRSATGAETYGEAGLAIFNTANEAAFQATAQYTETKQQLLEARERGENQYSDREIQELSGKAAASSFGWNFPALMVSNAWEMKNILKPIVGRGKNPSLNSSRTIVTETGKLGFKPYSNKLFGKIAESGIGKTVRFYTPIAIKGTLMEGFWEENIQLAIDRAARGEYARYGDDTEGGQVMEKSTGGFFGILGQYAKQTVDALKGNDIENSMGIGTGALIGALGGIGGAKFGRRINPLTGKSSFVLGERRQQQIALDAVIEETNNAYNNFLSVQDTRNVDGTVNGAKLADKVTAFENFTRRQAVLDELKDKKNYPPHELEALQNELLNQYAKGLIKIDQLQNAVTRIQDLANRNVEEKGEKFISNPVQVATYLAGLAEEYNNAHNRPDHLSEKHTPAQMQEINTAIKDRAYDLRAHRKAIDPILKFYQKQSLDNFNIILNNLQNDPRGEDIQQGFARNRVTDYIQALAKKEVFTELLGQVDNPEFMKEYHRQRIKEANDAIAVYNKELGVNAPEIKDGEITFKDEILDFEDKSKQGLKPYLDNYRTAYKDEALIEFSQQSYEHLANAIQNPTNGLQNWFDYRDTAIAAAARENIPTQQTYKVGEKTYPSLQALDEALKNGEITQVQYDAAVNTVATPPVQEEDIIEEVVTSDVVDDPIEVTKETIETDPVKAVRTETDSIDPNEPLSWYSPNRKSGDDTISINKETEQLRDRPYDEALKAIIQKHITNVKDTNDKYKFFIVKDTFPAIYATPASNEEQDIVPTGEVIVMKDLNGKHLTIGDLLPGKFKDLKSLPVVFSFSRDIFGNYRVAEREAIWEAKMEKQPGEAAVFYEAEYQKNLAARKFVNDNPGAEIQIVPVHSNNGGLMPTTDNVVPVIQRFGDAFTVDLHLLKTKQFEKGTIVATFGKVSFPVGTTRLRAVGSELTKVEQVLAKQFDTKQQAERVRNDYLSVLFFTNEDQNFGIRQVEDKFQIYFRKIDKKYTGLPKEKKVNFLKPSTAYGELRFNVANSALKDGMNIYNSDTNTFEGITAEQYQDFIKTKLVTNLKKTLDKDGNLYMKPVNAYFSFRIEDNKLQEQKPAVVKESTYNKVVNRIKQLIDTKGLTKENLTDIKKGVQESLKQKLITQDQFTKLNERLTELEAEIKEKATPVAKKPETKGNYFPFGSLEEAKADIEKRRQKDIATKVVNPIFPSTQLKEVVYHGTKKKFDKFKGDRGFFFSTFSSSAKTYAKQASQQSENKEGVVLPSILNIKNPIIESPEESSKEKQLGNFRKWEDKSGKKVPFLKEENGNRVPSFFNKEYQEYFNKLGFDSFMWANKAEISVFKPEQIHILSDKEITTVNEINAEYDAELAALEPKKTPPVPKPKTDEQEEDEEDRFNRLIQQGKAKGRKKKDVNEVLGNVPSAASVQDYTVSIGEKTYKLTQSSGAIKDKLGITIHKIAPVLAQILPEMAKNYPFTKGNDGSISGVFTAELEGKDGRLITAYGLPAERNNEYYIDDKNKPIAAPSSEISTSEHVKTLLTEKGKEQLEAFFKRNC